MKSLRKGDWIDEKPGNGAARGVENAAVRLAIVDTHADFGGSDKIAAAVGGEGEGSGGREGE